MTNNPQFSDATIIAAVGAVTPLLNSGFLDFYTGSQPADANQAVTGTQLVSCALSATAFGTPSASGATGSRVVTATANTISTGTAGNTGTAGYCVLYKSDHATVVAMGSVGTTGADVNLSSTSIVSGGTVQITSFTLTQAET